MRKQTFELTATYLLKDKNIMLWFAETQLANLMRQSNSISTK